MQEIKEVVKKVLEELNSQRKNSDCRRINLLLKKVLSPKEFRHVYIHSLKRKRLRINTDSVVFLYQLNLKKNLILKKIQEDIGPNFVEEIVFRLGGIRNG